MTGTSVFVVSPDFPSLPSYAMLAGDYRTSIMQARRLGYDGIEIILGDPEKFDAALLRSALDEAGMQISALNSGGIEYIFGASLVNADAEKERFALQCLKRSIDHCAELGCLQQVGVARGFAIPGTPMRLFRERLVNALQELAGYALDRGVRLVFEYTNRFEINTINTGAEALEIVRRTGASNVGLLIDTYHSYLEDADVCQNIRDLGDFVRHFHLHDSNGGAAVVSGGENDFDAIIETCAEIGYDGWFSDGLRTLTYPQAEVRRSTAALRDLYAKHGLYDHAERFADTIPLAARYSQ